MYVVVVTHSVSLLRRLRALRWGPAAEPGSPLTASSSSSSLGSGWTLAGWGCLRQCSLAGCSWQERSAWRRHRAWHLGSVTRSRASRPGHLPRLPCHHWGRPHRGGCLGCGLRVAQGSACPSNQEAEVMGWGAGQACEASGVTAPRTLSRPLASLLLPCVGLCSQKPHDGPGGHRSDAGLTLARRWGPGVDAVDAALVLAPQGPRWPSGGGRGRGHRGNQGLVSTRVSATRSRVRLREFLFS